MKKIVTLIMTLAMLAVSTISVFAAGDGFYPKNSESFSITINGTCENAKFEAYQILSGDLFIENNGSTQTLSNIEWGEGIAANAGTFLGKLKADSLIKSHYLNVNNASQYADAIQSTTHLDYLASLMKESVDTSKKIALVKESSTNVYKAVGLKPGYYLVVDNSDHSDSHIQLRLMVRVVGDIEITPDEKSVNTPILTKKVVDINDSNLDDVLMQQTIDSFTYDTTYQNIDQLKGAWHDSADHEVGDTIIYRLDAQMPNDLETYSVYKLIFNDYLSEGITETGMLLKENSFSPDESIPNFNASENNSSAITVAESAYNWYKDKSNTKITNDSTVYYTNEQLAKLDVRLFIGSQEQSLSRVEYPVLPKDIYDKLPMYNDLAADVTTKLTDVEKNSKDEAQIKELVSNKIANGNYLYKGNCFYFWPKDVPNSEGYPSGTHGAQFGSDDIRHITKNGEHITVFYKCILNEKATIGYSSTTLNGNPNEANLTYSTEVTGGGLKDGPKDKVNVWTYELDITKIIQGTTTALNGADFKLEKYNATTNQWDVVETVYGNGAKRSTYLNEADNYKTNGSSQTALEEEHKALLKSNSKFRFVGIDDGVYKLSEKVVPNGYNKLEDIYFEMVAEHDLNSDNPSLTALSVRKGSFDATTKKFTAFDDIASQTFNQIDKNKDGKIEIDVENKKGITLPSTGGIGTTMFYIAGAAMVVGAMVILIANKKTEDK